MVRAEARMDKAAARADTTRAAANIIREATRRTTAATALHPVSLVARMVKAALPGRRGMIGDIRVSVPILIEEKECY